MIEHNEYSPVKEGFMPTGLQRAIWSAWPENTTSNLERLTSPDLRAVITLCPLYGQGTLDESKVLPIGEAAIHASRVANKWNAVQQVVRSVHEYAKSVDGKVSLTAVFANKGILFNGEPTEADYEAVLAHDEVYQEILGEYCEAQDIDLTYYTYDDLDVVFPRFVNPIQNPPHIEQTGLPDNKRMVAELNTFSTAMGIPVQIADVGKNRDIIDRLSRVNGISRNGVFWTIAGYLAFDYKLPELLGDNGFYIATERFEPHFGITSMTPGLREIPKVKLKA